MEVDRAHMENAFSLALRILRYLDSDVLLQHSQTHSPTVQKVLNGKSKWEHAPAYRGPAKSVLVRSRALQRLLKPDFTAVQNKKKNACRR